VRDLGFKEHGDEFLGFLFVSYTPNLKVKKLVTKKCQYAQKKEKKNKKTEKALVKSALSSHGTRKGTI